MMPRNSLAVFLVLVVASFVAVPQADAAVVGFDPAGTATFTDVITFDYAPGNALAKGGNQAVQTFIQTGLANPFMTYFQARLSTVIRPDSSLKDVSSNNITIVLGFPEVVTAAVGNFATFAGAPGILGSSYVEMWAGGAAASDLAGTGFNDGTRIMTGRVQVVNSSQLVTSQNAGNLDNFGGNDYPGQLSVGASGSTDLTAVVDFLDPNYFNPLSVAQGGLINLSLFNANQVLPFNQINPSGAFVEGSGGLAPVADGAGVGAASIGTINGLLPIGPGLGGPDVQFQTDGNSSFGVVPEPASVAVWSFICMAFGCIRLRRRAA